MTREQWLRRWKISKRGNEYTSIKDVVVDNTYTIVETELEFTAYGRESSGIVDRVVVGCGGLRVDLPGDGRSVQQMKELLWPQGLGRPFDAEELLNSGSVP